jgi:hypothetical protein
MRSGYSTFARISENRLKTGNTQVKVRQVSGNNWAIYGQSFLKIRVNSLQYKQINISKVPGCYE